MYSSFFASNIFISHPRFPLALVPSHPSCALSLSLSPSLYFPSARSPSFRYWFIWFVFSLSSFTSMFLLSPSRSSVLIHPLSLSLVRSSVVFLYLNLSCTPAHSLFQPLIFTLSLACFFSFSRSLYLILLLVFILFLWLVLSPHPARFLSFFHPFFLPLAPLSSHHCRWFSLSHSTSFSHLLSRFLCFSRCLLFPWLVFSLFVFSFFHQFSLFFSVARFLPFSLVFYKITYSYTCRLWICLDFFTLLPDFRPLQYEKVGPAFPFVSLWCCVCRLPTVWIDFY